MRGKRAPGLEVGAKRANNNLDILIAVLFLSSLYSCVSNNMGVCIKRGGGANVSKINKRGYEIGVGGGDWGG